MTWLRLEVRRRWRSLLVLALLVALATGTVLAAAAGARRGETAFERLWDQHAARDRDRAAQPARLRLGQGPRPARGRRGSEFPVTFGFALTCCPEAGAGFPPIGDEYGRTIERPDLLAGRMFDPARADEVIVTPQFAAAYHKGVGDTRDHAPGQPKQVNEQYDGTTGPPRGPAVQARITGVGRSLLGVHRLRTVPARRAGVQASPALYDHYQANILGTNGQNVHQRADPAQGRYRGHSRVPRRPGPGDRPVGHRRVEQPGVLR